MIKKYLSLGIALFIQILLINMIFGQLKFDSSNENYETSKMLANIIELLLLLIVNVAIIYNVLKNDLDRVTMYFCIGLSSTVILLYWLVYKTEILANYITKVDYDIPDQMLNNSNNFNSNNSNNSNISNKIAEPTKPPFEGVAFSKYHNKDTNRDFSFENAYPNYNNIEPSLEPVNGNSNSNSNTNSNSAPDYSMYNGYDPSNICYQCKCIEEEDGDKFCAKEIPGMGRIGCSERWECQNCKDCQSWDDDRFVQTEQDNTDKRYTCQDCKCLDTTAGKICGRVSRADGFVQKCSSDCSRCDKCYGTKSNRNSSNSSSNSNSNSSNRYITIDPSSNLNRVIVNNLKNTDLNEILD